MKFSALGCFILAFLFLCYDPNGWQRFSFARNPQQDPHTPSLFSIASRYHNMNPFMIALYFQTRRATLSPNTYLLSSCQHDVAQLLVILLTTQAHALCVLDCDWITGCCLYHWWAVVRRLSTTISISFFFCFGGLVAVVNSDSGWSVVSTRKR